MQMMKYHFMLYRSCSGFCNQRFIGTHIFRDRIGIFHIYISGDTARLSYDRALPIYYRQTDVELFYLYQFKIYLSMLGHYFAPCREPQVSLNERTYLFQVFFCYSCPAAMFLIFQRLLETVLESNSTLDRFEFHTKSMFLNLL